VNGKIGKFCKKKCKGATKCDKADFEAIGNSDCVFVGQSQKCVKICKKICREKCEETPICIIPESCDDLATTTTNCEAGVAATPPFNAKEKKDKFCTVSIQKTCPVSCMGAETTGDQCVVKTESCDDLATTTTNCEAGVAPNEFFNAKEKKDKFCTFDIQKTCPVSCMGAETTGAACIDL